MNKGDQLIERGAARLEQLSREAAAKGGLSAKLADELAEDAAFLRQLKPSLIAARARGQAPKAQQPPPAPRSAANEPSAPSAPQLKQKRPKKKRKGGGPNPFLVAGVALAAGIALAKIVDWRGHAHPRD